MSRSARAGDYARDPYRIAVGPPIRAPLQADTEFDGRFSLFHLVSPGFSYKGKKLEGREASVGGKFKVSCLKFKVAVPERGI